MCVKKLVVIVWLLLLLLLLLLLVLVVVVACVDGPLRMRHRLLLRLLHSDGARYLPRMRVQQFVGVLVRHVLAQSLPGAGAGGRS